MSIHPIYRLLGNYYINTAIYRVDSIYSHLVCAMQKIKKTKETTELHFACLPEFYQLYRCHTLRNHKFRFLPLSQLLITGNEQTFTTFKLRTFELSHTNFNHYFASIFTLYTISVSRKNTARRPNNSKT